MSVSRRAMCGRLLVLHDTMYLALLHGILWLPLWESFLFPCSMCAHDAGGVGGGAAVQPAGADA